MGGRRDGEILKRARGVCVETIAVLSNWSIGGDDYDEDEDGHGTRRFEK